MLQDTLKESLEAEKLMLQQSKNLAEKKYSEIDEQVISSSSFTIFSNL